MLAVFADFGSGQKDGSGLSSTHLRRRAQRLRTVFPDRGGPRDEDSLFTDQGETEFAFSVVPRRSGAQPDFSDITRRAELFNTRPSVILENNHEGTLPDRMEGIAVDADNVLVTALKGAEDGDGTVIRLNETAGKDTTAHVALGGVFMRSSALLRPEMERVIQEESLPSARRACKVLPSGLGENIGDNAALSIAIGGY